jgi:ABC-2 type transport system permease protein
MGIVGCITILTYLSDCLFSERKDRSILFWKSLPVSDAKTVLSKLAVAMLVLPLGLILLSVLTHFAVSGIMLLRFQDMQGLTGVGYWSGWASALGRIAVCCLFAVLWYLPVAAYQMLASVLAKRAPLMYVVLPPVLLILGERLLLETGHIATFVIGRLVPRNAESLLRPNGALWMPFQDVNLWMGLAVAAGMLYIVIRLRRYRDDT